MTDIRLRHMKTKLIRRCRYGLAALTWMVCAPVLAGTLQGTALYRERIALPPDAVFVAELHDVSRADAPSEVIGRATLDPAGNPPFRFEIGYDDAALVPGHRYAVRANVSHQGQPRFTTIENYPVLDGRDAPLNIMLVSARGGKTPVAESSALDLPASYEGEFPGANSLIVWHLDLLPEGRYRLRSTYRDKPEPNGFDELGRWRNSPDTGWLELFRSNDQPLYFAQQPDGALRKLDAAGNPIASMHNDRLQRLPEPVLIEPRLALSGMFSYLADAAMITLCADGSKLPVAMEADYKALEAAYLQARQQPGQALLVNVEGLIAQRPSAEESQPPRATLVVERYVSVSPRESCGQPLTDSPLRGTYWKLVRLGNNTPVELAEKQQEPHLIFSAEQPRISGSGGCNRIMGSFELDDDKLRLGQRAGTMMACLEGMELEQQFLNALTKVERYRIHGSHLEMLDAEGTLIAKFEAVALR